VGYGRPTAGSGRNPRWIQLSSFSCRNKTLTQIADRKSLFIGIAVAHGLKKITNLQSLGSGFFDGHFVRGYGIQVGHQNLFFSFYVYSFNDFFFLKKIIIMGFLICDNSQYIFFVNS
jgi:hypothetical protein